MSPRWPWARRRWDERRWVVVDVETTGLNPTRDRLLALAGVAVRLDDGTPQVVPGDSFEVVLRQHTAVLDKPNILLHGIGVGAQRAGADPPAGLARFEAWVASSPLIAFHAAFDEVVIQRAAKAALGRRLAGSWLDLEALARLARPDVAARSLDDWLAAFDVAVAMRHQAAADALATAQLLQALWPALIASREPMDFTSLRKRAQQLRWLGIGN